MANLAIFFDDPIGVEPGEPKQARGNTPNSNTAGCNHGADSAVRLFGTYLLFDLFEREREIGREAETEINNSLRTDCGITTRSH